MPEFSIKVERRIPLKEDITKEFDKKFQYLIGDYSKIPYGIYYKGRQLKTWNGKTTWSMKGHARSAFNNMIQYDNYKKFGFETKKEFVDYLIQEKIIEIKQI